MFLPADRCIEETKKEEWIRAWRGSGPGKISVVNLNTQGRPRINPQLVSRGRLGGCKIEPRPRASFRATSLVDPRIGPGVHPNSASSLARGALVCSSPDGAVGGMYILGQGVAAWAFSWLLLTSSFSHLTISSASKAQGTASVVLSVTPFLSRSWDSLLVIDFILLVDFRPVF